MSVQLIIANLEKLEKMHKSLLELAYKKTELVKKGNMEELDEMLKNEQSHVAAIELLEKQRQQMVTDYLRAKGIALAGTPTVADVINAADVIEERETLEKVRTSLLSTINEVKQQNALNQKLVYQSLQVVNATLNILQPQSEEINYSGNAVRRDYTAAKKSLFDSQA
ncbi:flagellar protein FlgN [Lysinibacillus yapensis]|uniref:Flagellar protein FlgN n=1 Tax=Ureibacillus yapensis TaxID=2304605 RepID=A0A396SKP9_9BACL|nr:flagellar protein FlgN [Lysinibacillus yapensis]RHW39939.1 flagellar protein FlgN [Lysinibacillus yapensis]